MPLPGWLARFNRRVTNRVTGPAAHRLPGFAVIRHVGRRSGRLYSTPVNLFGSNDHFVIALTYGRDRDWVKNVLAAGGCEVVTRGTSIKLAHPRIVTHQHHTLVPAPIRSILKTIGVTEYMELTLNHMS
ncbi:MAG: nitroreductase family deazaflavin-dependent oxidoreductase [Actinobacteria bacterium]|nr:nitroreductase family deazaflavin-dependent oxidoreductase [Actinomycetota bacterium]